jgi:peroxiredoxin
MRFPRLSANGWLLAGLCFILAGLVGEPAYIAITGHKSAEQLRQEKMEAEALRLAAGPSVGDTALDFTLKKEANIQQAVSLRDFKGKRVLISFYCGCYLCRGTAKELEKLSKLPPKNRPVMLGLCSFSPDRLVPFIHDTGAKHTVYLFDDHKQVGQRWGSTKCPRTWLIDEKGRISYRHEEPEGEMQPSPVPLQVRAVLERPQMLQTTARQNAPGAPPAP